MARYYRLSIAACDALSAASLAAGGGGLKGATPEDDDGFVSIQISQPVLNKMLELNPSLDLDNPVELSEWIQDLVHNNLWDWQ